MSSVPERKSVLIQLGFGLGPISSFIHLDRVAGEHVAGETNRNLPLADSAVDGILVGYNVWKLSQTDLLVLLRECRRVLRPGGYIRISLAENQGDDIHLTKEHNGGKGETWEHLIQLAGLEPVGIQSLRDSALTELHQEGSDAICSRGVEARKERPPVYSDAEIPQVSILIPAYNPRFFYPSFESALVQTYPRIEIIVSDDSPTDEIKTIVEQVESDKRSIRYIRNEKPLGRYGNYQRCFDLAEGEYIKYLNDDDLLHADCVLRMARCLSRYPEVTLVTCHRQIIDAGGKALADIPATHRLVAEETILDGISVANAVLSRRLNFVGEPTTTMFRKRDLFPYHPSINSIAGIQIEYINDIAMWLNLLGKGKLIYLEQTLSYFRIHREQGQAEPDAEERSQTDWDNILAHGQRLGYWHPDWPATLRMRPLDIRSQWPEEILPIIAQARGHMAKKRNGEAYQVLVEASKISAGDPWILVALGDLSRQKGDTARAEQWYNKAIQYSPEYIPAYMSLGTLVLKQNRIDTAETLFKKLAQLQPLNIEPLKLLGRVYLKGERFEEGVRIFSAIVQQRPEDITSLSALGICHLGAGKPEAAETVFKRVLDIDPGNRLADDNLKLINDTLNRG